MKRGTWWFVFVVVLLGARPSPDPGPSSLSLLEAIDQAELIAIGTVVPRSGDARTLGAARQALTLEVLLKGERPSGEVPLMGARWPVFDDDTGELISFTTSSHAVSWTDGERVLTFLRRSEENPNAWSASYLGPRRPHPGDFTLYAEKVRAAVELLAQTRTVEQRHALRAWAVSLLDHEATLAEGAWVLVESARDPRGDLRLGRLDPEQSARVVATTLLHASRGGDPLDRAGELLLKLAEDIPSRGIDDYLLHLVSGHSKLDPEQRAEYATLLAKRLDDEALRDAATELSAHVDLMGKVAADPALRGPWEIKLQELCEGFREPARVAMQR